MALKIKYHYRGHQRLIGFANDKYHDIYEAMAAAVLEWQALDPAAKKAWSIEARRYGGRLSGYHLFLREQLSTA